MAQHLKRWESPRRQGRNDKGRGGTARKRQLRKQFQTLRKRLKEQSDELNDPSSHKKPQKQLQGKANSLPFFVGMVSRAIGG